MNDAKRKIEAIQYGVYQNSQQKAKKFSWELSNKTRNLDALRRRNAIYMSFIV